jgi:hypothetical protein
MNAKGQANPQKLQEAIKVKEIVVAFEILKKKNVSLLFVVLMGGIAGTRSTAAKIHKCWRSNSSNSDGCEQSNRVFHVSNLVSTR